MIAYFKMKKAQWQIRTALYQSILAFAAQKKDILDLARKTYTALKDVPADQLRQEVVAKLAELIREESGK